MRLVRIYTKADGHSAIEVRQVPMSGGERPASPTFQGGAMFFRETAEGHVQSCYVCRPGDLIFAEDTTGKGHITRSLRDTRGFVHVAMPEDFDVSGWPLVNVR